MVAHDDRWSRSCRSLVGYGHGVLGDSREMAIGSGRGLRNGGAVSESGGREAPELSHVSI